MQTALTFRMGVRFDQISVYYNEMVAALPDAERKLMPNLADMRHLPTIDALARQNNALGKVAREQFLALVPQILQEVEAYKAAAKAAAVEVMRESLCIKAWFDRWGDELQALAPEEAVARHYALFKCGIYPHAPGVEASYLTFEDMHDHWRTHHPKMRWNTREPCKYGRGGTRGHLWCTGEYGLGGQILDAAGLPRETPISVLNQLIRSGRLYCACGDPALPPPEELDWPKLVCLCASSRVCFCTLTSSSSSLYTLIGISRVTSGGEEKGKRTSRASGERRISPTMRAPARQSRE